MTEISEHLGRSPQSLIAQVSMEAGQPKTDEETQTAFAVRQVQASVLDRICDDLDAWEEQQQMRLMALPVQPLLDLRELWERGDDQMLMDEVVPILRDLFGGIDGHLVAIDRTLLR